VARIVNGLVSPPYRTLVMRRHMLSHAETLAEKIGAEALETGESIGQTASQTIRSIHLIGGGMKLPVLRSLSGSDKDEIVKEAMRIGTYEFNKRQVEVCGLAATPTPRGGVDRFKEEYDKVVDVVAPEPLEIDLKSRSLNEILESLKL
jgi:thiamine biosynthesis protein ThiI